jgi:hypothetical protein
MKRTQLYLDEELANILRTVSRQRRTTVSELVRECVREKFVNTEAVDKAVISRQIAGIWKNRRDLADSVKYVRTLRRDTRRKRFNLA